MHSKKTLEIIGKNERLLINAQNENFKDWKGRMALASSVKEEAKQKEGVVMVQGPGSYEVGGIEVHGMSSGDGAETIYMIVVDGVTVAYVGAIGGELTEKKLGRLEEGVDVLLISLGGALGAKRIMDLAKKCGANYVIPVDYTDEQLKQFLDVADVEDAVAVKTLKVTADSLPDGLEVSLLEVNGS